MIVTIVLGVFSVLLAYHSKLKSNLGLKVAFIFIFIFLALRYNFGNDYSYYLINFLNIGKSNLVDLINIGQPKLGDYYDLLLPSEPGWKVLNWLFKDIGFFAMNAVLAFLSCVIYYRFISKYVPSEYYWLAIFLYIFFPGFMLIHSSAMRQSIAIMIFIFSIDYLFRRDAIRYFLCILFSSLFHFSAIILFPIYLVVYFNRKIRLISGSFFVFLYSSLFLFTSYLAPYIKVAILGLSTKYYDSYKESSSVNSGFGFLYYSVLFLITLYFEKRQSRENAILFKIAILSFLLVPLPLIIQMTGRLTLYFTPVTMIVYPIIAKNLKNSKDKLMFLTMLVVLTLYQFFQFFYSEVYHEYYFVYTTIFSSPYWN